MLGFQECAYAYQIYSLKSHLGGARGSRHEDVDDVSPGEGEVVARLVDGDAEALQLRVELLDAEELGLLQHS